MAINEPCPAQHNTTHKPLSLSLSRTKLHSSEMVVAESAAAGNEMSLSNMVLGFYEEAERERWPEDAAGAGAGDGTDDEGSSTAGAAESRAFWQEQRSLLHVSQPHPSRRPSFQIPPNQCRLFVFTMAAAVR